jgi:hypothetical protein
MKPTSSVKALEEIAVLLIDARARLEKLDKATREQKACVQAHSAISRAHALVSTYARQAPGELTTH